MHAERGLQSGKHRRPFTGRNVARHVAMTRDIVAQQHDDIRIERIGAFDDRLNAIQRHPGIAGMQVGDDRDLERKISRPLRRGNIVARDAKPQHRLDAEPIGRG